MESKGQKVRSPNHLINEKSPYLQQHAHNPVDWYPWGEEAFRLAVALDKPIFLSIGYSTCHWCHVMERESFEDDEVAKMLNDTFVCIKVDREERPDVDSIYMHFCQATTGSGGWPLNVVLTPDRKPVFAMTYLPRNTRRGLMGITEMATSIAELWKNQRSDLVERSESITEQLKNMIRQERASGIPAGIQKSAFENFKTSFDRDNGGFGTSPKFPSPHNLVFLLRYYKSTDQIIALDMVEKTLIRMRLGGIFDHVGYGFHRYSTDPFWIVPHFEKMLYDQAMLILAYTEAYQVTGREFYRSVVEEIFIFLQRDMRTDEGVYCSAIDADSEGIEGKYYLWRKDEIDRIAGEDAEALENLYNVSVNGNFNVSEGNMPAGMNILYISDISYETALKIPWMDQKTREDLDKMRSERAKRTMPHIDRKILTDINSLLAYSLLKASAVFKKDEYRDAGTEILSFIRKNMLKNGGMVMHSYMDGETGADGFLDDYVFLTAALLEYYQCSGNEEYLLTAVEIQKHLELHFADENGGYYLAADYESSNIMRMKPDMDGAIPSGNSVQMLNLVFLSQILEDESYLRIAERIPSTLTKSLSAAPQFHSFLISAIPYLQSHFGIRKKVSESDVFREYSDIMKGYVPDSVFIPLISGRVYEIEALKEISESSALEGGKYQVCSGKECYLPVASAQEVLNMIRKNRTIS